jgi:hypothetical protein
LLRGPVGIVCAYTLRLDRPLLDLSVVEFAQRYHEGELVSAFRLGAATADEYLEAAAALSLGRAVIAQARERAEAIRDALAWQAPW